MEVLQTVCGMCSGDNCGIDVYVEDGKIVNIKGTRQNPLNEGRLCVQSQGAPELIEDPGRLSHPLRRDGDEWRRISWDEALDTIAARLLDIKARYGAQSFALWEGLPMLGFDRDGWQHRFLNLYGSPNWVLHDHMCYMPSVIAETVTYGHVQVDFFDPAYTRCVVLWGSNPATSHNPYQWHAVQAAQKRGATLIVVDPRRSQPAAAADLHVAPRPGTDNALALSLLNLIIAEKLYDADFVERWTVGFEPLAERVRPFTPRRVAEITGVPEASVRRFAELYGSTRPAHLDAGNAFEHHTNSGQTLRALMILRGLTGNLDVPGGHMLSTDLPLADMRLPGRCPPGLKPLGADRYPLFVEIAEFVPGDALIETMLTGKPYPIKAAYLQGTNPMLTWPNTRRVGEALGCLDFLVVMDLFMTPTAWLADLVLPAASGYEKTQLIATTSHYGAGKPTSWISLRRPVVDPGERRSEWWVLRNLAHRMGFGRYYPWETEEQAIDAQLAPLGLGVADLKSHPVGLFYGAPPQPYGYRQGGFRTPSGKVEFYSHTLAAHGHDPLPCYEEPAEGPVSAPDVAADYPLVLNAGRRVAGYTHSRYRGLSGLRKREPVPVAEIHPTTAQRYGIADGDPVVVESPRGQIRLQARVTLDIVPGTVGLLHGWEEANANLLTDDRTTDPVLATPALRSGLCRIRREEPGGSTA